jgi:hypothetical protein
MLASSAKQGPKIPHYGEPYTIEVEGGDIDDISIEHGYGFIQAIRLKGTTPITVYANCED